MSERWINQTVWRQLRVAPPYAWRFRLPPKNPRDGRIMSNRQLPYEGYRDRETGNYWMKHNRMMTEDEIRDAHDG